MTEKRFVDYFDKDHNYIIQDLQNEDEYQVGFVHCDEDVFLELVNKIAEENEVLQKKNDNLVNMIARVQYRADLIKDENEQLKADKQSLIDFIKKEFPKSHKHILEGFE